MIFRKSSDRAGFIGVEVSDELKAGKDATLVEPSEYPRLHL